MSKDARLYEATLTLPDGQKKVMVLDGVSKLQALDKARVLFNDKLVGKVTVKHLGFGQFAPFCNMEYVYK